MKFYPYKTGFSRAEGGGGATTSFGVAFTLWLEVLAIMKWGAKCFHLLKQGGGREAFKGL